MSDFGPDTAAVRRLLAAAVAMTPTVRGDLQARAFKNRAFIQARSAVRDAMGWNLPVQPPRTAAEEEHRAAMFSPMFKAWAAGYNLRPGEPACSEVAWTALAVAGQSVLPDNLYRALVGPWEAIVGPASVDDLEVVHAGDPA